MNGGDGDRGRAGQGSPPGQASAQPGLTPVPAATRGGEDARRRGWFWHWNALVTQYAPLIGLKGVGLLNSYTVWTDRREESPHRGYAFPSQQSEADFYGEDRAELIAINKILVALDLIEIRKEMVDRTDPQGRRWKVPHNFYRVKDRDDGFCLSAPDVLKVAALADTDKAVYRYVRRVFSPRFAPIDRDNVWHRILPEVRRTPLWQKLAGRAEAEERRASARTRAGHAARRPSGDGGNDAAPFFAPDDGDMPAGERVDSASAAVATPRGGETGVDGINTGSGGVVDAGNNGLDAPGRTVVGRRNRGEATTVDGTNTTYYDERSTTKEVKPEVVPTPASGLEDPPGRQRQEETAGRGLGSAPADGPGQAAAIRAFEEANARSATPAERKLLAAIAERFEPAAGAAGGSGWEWLAAGVYEAVEAGSAFVAPRRLREILARWERDGYPHPGVGGSAGRQVGQGAPRGRGEPGQPGGAAGGTGLERMAAAEGGAGSVPPGPVRLPGGRDGGRVWAEALRRLAGALDASVLADLADGSAILGEADGQIVVAVRDGAAADRWSGGYAGLVGRKVSEALGHPVSVRFVAAEIGAAARRQGDEAARRRGGEGAERETTHDSRLTTHDSTPRLLPSSPPFVVAECGLTAGAVWSAVVAEVVAAGAVAPAEADAWLRPAVLLGRGGQGGPGSALVVGVAHALAKRRVEGRHRPALEAAAAVVLGRPVAIEVVVTREWAAGTDGSPGDGRAAGAGG